jgi:hypothetical protein
MDAMRMADVAARVVAWHNRHPLARRVTLADIGPVGVVALPFATASGDAATPGAAARPLFDGGWMYRARTHRLPAWVLAHGLADAAAFAGWPRRQIDADLAASRRADADGLDGRTLRHVPSTVVERDGQRTRVLVGATRGGGHGAVFGRRLWSLPRTGALAAAATAAMAAFVVGMAPVVPPAPLAPLAPLEPLGPPVPSRAARPPAGLADAGSATASAMPVAPPTPPTASAPPTPSAPSAPPEAMAAPAATAAPPAIEPAARPTSRRVAVELRPPLSETERRAARQAAEQARAARAIGVAARPGRAPAGAAPPAPDAALAAATPGVAARVPAPTGAAGPAGAARPPHDTNGKDGGAGTVTADRLYAIASRALDSQADARAQEALLRGLVAIQPTPYATRLELLQAQGRWRAVWWPHPEREHAEALLLLARQRGLRVELVEF